MATPDTACHFRHCVRLYSEATDQGLMYLTSEVTGSSPSAVASGRVFVGHATTYCWNQHWWLLTDRPGSSDEPGVGYLCDTFTSSSIYADTTKFHAVACAAQAGAHPAADHTVPNSYGALQQWEFVDDEGALVIRKPGTLLCLTAGSSPSNSIGASSVQCSLTTYDGSSNQRWNIMEPSLPCNIYQLAPALDPALAIATPGQISQDDAPLGIESYDETDPSATWMGWYQSDGTHGYGVSIISWTRYDSPGQKALAGISDSGTAAGVKLVQQVKSVPDAPSSLFDPAADVAPYPQRQLSGAAYKTATMRGSGYYYAHQFSTSSAATRAISSSDGTIPVAASPYAQALVASMEQSNAPQFLYTLPRNFHNQGLPTPYDLQLVCRDVWTGEEWTLGATDEMPLSSSIQITPRFICDWDAFSVICRIRFRSPSETTWGEWHQVETPINGNAIAIRQTPWLIPDGPEAWVPNAWAGDVDDDGYRSLTQPINLSSIMYSHAGQIMQISVTVKAFEYRASYRYPWAPYTGPGATFTSIIAARPTITPSRAWISEDGLHISYGSSQLLGSGHHLMITSLRVMDSYGWKGQLLADPYDAPIYEQIGELVVPMSSFDGDAIVDLVEKKQAGTYIYLNIDGRLVTQYGSQPFSSSSLALIMESGSSVLPTSTPSQQQLGQWMTIMYAWSSSGYHWTTSYQLLASENRSSLMPLTSYVDGSAMRIARHMVGQSLTITPSSQTSLIFMRNSSNLLGYRVIRETRYETRPIASLSWVDTRGVVHLIPVQGDLNFSYSSSKRIESAQRLGGHKFISGSWGGSTPSLKFSGVIFRDELSHITMPTTTNLVFEQDVSALYRIPADVDVLFRTTYGTGYLVRIVRVDAPRTVSGMAQVSIEMLEVEPS